VALRAGVGGSAALATAAAQRRPWMGLLCGIEPVIDEFVSRADFADLVRQAQHPNCERGGGKVGEGFSGGGGIPADLEQTIGPDGEVKGGEEALGQCQGTSSLADLVAGRGIEPPRTYGSGSFQGYASASSATPATLK